ncbi:hypothetical protein SAMN02745132_03549 [Enterovibrio nigricans DSM 22720]|uniref:Uncharacterized protein n=2 Tax=Enterovibrio nigricans TaxID=504469 RepID=A0A1T4VAI5_9GAMM|nr:hypothetical protein SAMN02745132_03549 [Enterovibrio nigricans DSM 22720]
MQSPAQKIVKANYQTVTDDVVLPRNITYTPVNPKPDNKIVVEFAGQWPGNAASLMLGKTETQGEKVTKPRSDNHNKHRSLAVFKDLEIEPRNLYMTMPMKGMKDPLKLLLAENIAPVSSDEDMAEWENVLVPVVPMYFTTPEQTGESASLYESGYLYIIWNNKVWREIAIDASGYYSDIDLNHERNKPENVVLPTRHADICLIDAETLARYVSEPFALIQNGETVCEGVLNEQGERRVFNLTEESVDVVLTDYEEPLVFQVETHPSPFKGGKTASRVANGMPMPHVWLPHKINGEDQTLFMFFSEDPLSNVELIKLEENPSTVATEITGMQEYSNNKAFSAGATTIRSLVVPVIDEENSANYHVLTNQIETNIAGAYLNRPAASLLFTYPGCRENDESDDYFELRESEGEWCQRVYLRECGINDDNNREVRFWGWPSKVESVDLVRGYLGQKRYARVNETHILRNAQLTDLLVGKSAAETA